MNERTKNLIACGVILLGLTAMVIGALRGEAADILRKATMICMECIGLG